MTSLQKHIAHLDLDCFFVSVERIKDASLRGKPVAVGGNGKRGVISSASYEARTFGVHSAMPTHKALTLCPQLIVVPGSHGEYGKISKKLFERMCDFSPIVERASIDEMYMDFTGCEQLYANNLPRLMYDLQKLVLREFQLPCTFSLASNKVVAKIAAGTAKPNGVCYVPRGTEKDFLYSLPIEVIPGVGQKTEKLLKQYGYTRIADIQKIPIETLTALLGEHGSYIYTTAMGKGNDELEVEWKRKSISNETTFGDDTRDEQTLLKILFTLTEEVCFTTRVYKWNAKTVKLKLRYSDFSTISRSVTLHNPTHDDKIIFDAVKTLLLKTWNKKNRVRLLGVGVSQFSEAAEGNMSLFSQDEKRTKALNAVDVLKKKFGDNAIHTGSQ